MNILDHSERVFWVTSVFAVPNLFDPGSGMEKQNSVRGSGINISDS
jgi:hypothetical protein